MPLIITTTINLLGTTTATPYGTVSFTKRGHAVATVLQALFLEEADGITVIDNEINPPDEDKVSYDGIYQGDNLVKVTTKLSHLFGAKSATPHGPVVFSDKGVAVVPPKIAEFFGEFPSEYIVDKSGESVTSLPDPLDYIPEKGIPDGGNQANQPELAYDEAKALNLKDLKKYAIGKGISVPSGSKIDDILPLLFGHGQSETVTLSNGTTPKDDLDGASNA